MTGTEPDDQDGQIVEITQERGGANEVVQVLSVADVARMHNDEPIRQVLRPRPVVLTRAGHDCGSVDPVGNDRDPLGRGALCDEPLAHAVADRHDVVGPLEVEGDQAPQHLDD